MKAVLRKAYPLWFERLDRETNPTATASMPFAFNTVDALLRCVRVTPCLRGTGPPLLHPAA